MAKGRVQVPLRSQDVETVRGQGFSTIQNAARLQMTPNRSQPIGPAKSDRQKGV